MRKGLTTVSLPNQKELTHTWFAYSNRTHIRSENLFVNQMSFKGEAQEENFHKAQLQHYSLNGSNGALLKISREPGVPGPGRIL